MYMRGVGTSLVAMLFVLGAAGMFAGTGAAAGDIIITDIDAPSTVEPGDRVRVRVTVENDLGERADEVEVRVRGFDQLRERTVHDLADGDDTTVSVYLNVPDDADGRHDVRVTAQAREDDGTILADDSAQQTVRVDDGGTTDTSGTDIEIRQVAVPARVQAGEEITFDVAVENTGDTTITGMDVRVQAFGQLKQEENMRLERGREKTVTLTMTVPRDASGPEDVEITAEGGGERDVTTVTLDVAALHMTLSLSPNPATATEPVTVSGSMSASDVSADLYVDGVHEATVTSDETAQYTHTITPERAGSVRVTLRAGGVTAEKILRVTPTVGVTSLTGPGRVATGERFETCATVTTATAGTLDVALLIDGATAETRTVAVDDTEDVCFTTAIEGTGDRTITVRAARDGATATAGTTVSVVETGATAAVFPRQLTLQTGQAGVLRVEITNDELRGRTFTVSTDLANLTDRQERTITLDRGTDDTVVLRLVPPEIGTYDGTVTVEADGVTIMEETVSVTAVENPPTTLPGAGAAGDIVDPVMERLQGLPVRARWIVAGLIGIVVLGAAWLWRRRRHNVMEPQYN